jgi:eukaryotic-like serine/threonine-protein kinase
MSSGPPSESGQATLSRGATIGRYVILGLVGRGGMGEVYAAYDPELDRKVAVKLVRVKPGAGVTVTEGRQRTLREAQAIARLSHPNVVVVYDVGTFRDQVFIAMEFVEGNTVTYWVESQTRSWQEVLKVFMAAGRGLAAAHDKGLVHRDFKPDNVMVGKTGEVRVMDFGLARQVNDRGDSDSDEGVPIKSRAAQAAGALSGPHVDPMSTVVLNQPANTAAAETSSGPTMLDARLTRTGAMMGTPAYMAPEQFLGTGSDARTDQFAFCIALYEALYGERPFAGNTMFALTSSVVQGNVREEPANSKVPFWVRKVLLRGLRPKASERWASMLELLDALGKNPTAQRRKWLTATAAAVLPIALAFGISKTIAGREPPCSGGPAKLEGIWELQEAGEAETPRKVQIHRAFVQTGKRYAEDVHATVFKALTNYARGWANMHREVCEATEIHKEQSAEVLDLRMTCLQERLAGLRALTNVFAQATSEVVENAVSAANSLGSLDRCADVPVLRALVKPPDDVATRSRVAEIRDRLAGRKALFDAGQWRQAREGMPELVAEARNTGYTPLVAETLLRMAALLQRANLTREAEDTFLQAYVAAEASRHDEVRAEAARGLLWVVGYLGGRHAEGRHWAKLADAILQRLGGHDLMQAWLVNDLGGLLGLMGQKQEMLEAEKRALLLKEKALGPAHPDVGFSEGNIAYSLFELGKNQEALGHIDRAVAIVSKGLGTSHPDYAIVLSNRGEILNALGRFGDARESFQAAMVTFEREVSADDRNLAYALTGLGMGWLQTGRFVEAIAPLERAMKIREKAEPESLKVSETKFALARALWDSGRDRARARALADAARESLARTSETAKRAEVEMWLAKHAK